jgi:glycerol-1-phosphate dehydrogenase [NAD(P)+]
MNGYCSANSSIVSKEGLYGSIASKMPDYLIFDLEVLVEAPPRLLKAGIGDLLCYSSVLSDWLYSHIFFDSYFSVNIFKFIIDLQYMLISNISPGEWSSYELIQLVCKSIILSGLSMYIAGGSYPSSQGEHAIAHNYHLLNIDKTIHNLHGEEISVTSLIMMKIQQDLLKRDFLEILDASIANSIIDFRFAHMRKNQRNRLILYNNLIKSEKNIKKCWKIIGNVVDSATLTYDQLYQLYRSNGVKSSYSQLSWEKETLLQSVRQAAFLRERIGFLDLIGFYNQEQLLSFL